MELRHLLAYPVDGLDDVGARLTEDDEQGGRPAVGETDRSQVLDGIHYLAEVRQAHGGAIPPGHDERAVFLGEADLITRPDLPGSLGPMDLALGTIDVGIREHRPHILEADPIAC